MYTSSVRYYRPANTPSPRFDLSYYMSTHLSLFVKEWTPLGLRSCRVISYLDDPTSELAVLMTMEWPDERAFRKAVSNTELIGKGMEDVIVYTDLTPVMAQGPAYEVGGKDAA